MESNEEELSHCFWSNQAIDRAPCDTQRLLPSVLAPQTIHREKSLRTAYRSIEKASKSVYVTILKRIIAHGHVADEELKQRVRRLLGFFFGEKVSTVECAATHIARHHATLGVSQENHEAEGLVVPRHRDERRSKSRESQ